MKSIKRSKTSQFLIGLILILTISTICYFSAGFLGYRVVALILLFAVSLLAMLFDIIPVLIIAVFSALIWNFFFIPPLYNFTIGDPEDILLFLMYFIIALLNAVLTSKIQKAEIRSMEKEEKENTIKLYNTLLNSLSHELRTPISTIIGSVDILKDIGTKITEVTRSELLTEIDKASIRLNRQVENLLSMSRLESGFIQPKLDWCDLEELIHKVIHNNQHYFSSHRVRLTVEGQIPLFKLDQGLIESVIQNILINAVQYTPEKSTVSIRVEYINNNCIIAISDNGPGFPADKINHVFDKFYRLPDTSTGGTGLGLSIARGFVEAHNGSLNVRNLPVKGAEFIISIPAQVLFSDNIPNE